jgi:hypothetical protein
MKWFTKWFNQKVKQAWEEAQYAPEENTINIPRAISKNATLSSNGKSLDSDANMNFTVYNAIGGKVVEFRRYDRRNDRSEHQVYVISADQDFGERIAKIATMESIKQ